MDGQHSWSDYIADGVIVLVGWYTRIVFGDDRLTKKQTFAFFLLCGVSVFIVDIMPLNTPLKLGIMLFLSMAIPSIIRGFIKGSKNSEPTISKTVEKNVQNISNKVDDISDVITGKDNNN